MEFNKKEVFALKKKMMKSANNMVVMRETLATIANMASKVDNVGCVIACKMAKAIIRRADAALRAPARNCDVGTAKEQAERFNAFCSAHYDINNVDGECSRCPLTGNGDTCEFGWAQMPYKEREKQ